jgi:uncharacterized membrane protein YbhN (UPF0104 family)
MRAEPRTPSPLLISRPALLRGALTWVAAHLRAWLVLLVVLLLALTAWQKFRAIDFHQLRAELRALSASWLGLGFLLTLLNIASMGLYDVIALGRPADDPPTRVRWRIGAMAFAISSLVATGSLAGPALRLWLYREHGVSNQRIARAIVGTLIGLWGGLTIWIVTLAALPGAFWWLGAAMAPGLAWGTGRILERIQRPTLWPNGLKPSSAGPCCYSSVFSIGRWPPRSS